MSSSSWVVMKLTSRSGEIQVSLWDQETLDTCEEAGVQLL